VALTLPTGFQADLELKGRSSFAIVYELELAAGTLYLTGGGALTWNSNDYTPLVVSQSPVVQIMGTRVPEVRVSFTNVENTLEQHLTPVDLITGRRLRVRILSRDGNGDLRTGSIQLPVGIMERPKRADANTIEITAIGIGRGVLGMVPPRVASTWCNVHVFADLVDCNYVSTTTTSAVYSGGGGTTTILITDSAKFVDEFARLPSGSTIKVTVGSNTGLTATAAADSPDSITVNTEVSGGSAEAVSFDECDRTFAACQARERTHEYQGFQGVNSLNIDLIRNFGENFSLFGEPFPLSGLPGFVLLRDANGAQISTGRRPVPIGFGRRLIPGVLVEQLLTKWSNHTNNIQVSHYALSEGPISGIRAWFAVKRDEQGQPRQKTEEGGDELLTEGGDQLKILGIFQRLGGIGTDDTETEAEYVADPDTWTRSQNRDFLSNVQDPNSRTAIATFVMPRTTGEPEPYDRAEFDTELLKVTTYDSGGSVAVASQYNRNPIWHTVAVLTSDRFGLGRLIEASDIDFSVTQPAAAYCDTQIDGLVATVGVAAGTVTLEDGRVYWVDKSSGFQPGMEVLYNGPSYPNETDFVVGVPHPRMVILETDRTNGDSGDTITAKVERYTHSRWFTAQKTAEEVIANILSTCVGYITYNESGQIQVRAEQTGSSTATYKDTGADDGYLIKDFRWLTHDERFDPDINRVFVQWQTVQNFMQEVLSTDFDHLEAPHMLQSRVIPLPGVDNVEVATRLADIIRKKHRLGPSATFLAGPIALQQQPGDIITLTSVVGGFTAKEMRVRRIEAMGLGTDDALLVRLTCEDYDAAIYGVTDEAPIPPDYDTGIPTITLTADEVGSQIRLTWAVVPNGATVMGYVVYKSTTTMGTSPDASDAIGYLFFFNIAQSFVYDIQADDIGVSVFFQVAAFVSDGHRQLSNELTVTPGLQDPTETSDTPGINNVYDGGFEENPGTWTASASPFGAAVNPEQDYAPTNAPTTGSASDGAYTNPANGRDGDATTRATAIPAQGQSFVHAWRWTSGGAGEVGKLSASSAGAQAITANEFQKGFYSSDGGTTWVEFPVPFDIRSGSSTAADVMMLEVNRTDLEVAAQTTRSAGGLAITGSIAKVTWEPVTGVGAFVTEGRGFVVGDGAAVYGGLQRPWPGSQGRSGFLSAGKTFTSQIRVASFVAPTDPLRVQLFDGASQTFFDLIGTAGIPATTLDDVISTPPVGTWRAFAGNWAVPAGGLHGPFEIHVRTLSTEPIFVENLMVEVGDQIHKWAPHQNERTRSPARGVAAEFLPAGPWTSGLIRVATVTFNPN